MEKEGIILEEKSCPYEGTWYAHGKEITIDGIELICLNGRWEDKIGTDERYPAS